MHFTKHLFPIKILGQKTRTDLLSLYAYSTYTSHKKGRSGMIRYQYDIRNSDGQFQKMKILFMRAVSPRIVFIILTANQIYRESRLTFYNVVRICSFSM